MKVDWHIGEKYMILHLIGLNDTQFMHVCKLIGGNIYNIGHYFLVGHF